MTQLEAISSSLDDAAEIIGRQRLEISELRDALEKIAGNASRKEPRSYSTVGAPRNWSEETREAADRIAEEAFDQGYARACWEMGQIADIAIAKSGAAQ